AHDFHVIISKPERWRLSSPAKTRPARWGNGSSDIHIGELYHARRRGRPRPVQDCRGSVRPVLPLHHTRGSTAAIGDCATSGSTLGGLPAEHISSSGNTS